MTEETYYCGLCKKQMPIATHFPHDTDEGSLPINLGARSVIHDEFPDVSAQPFKAWLRSRLKQAKRDAIDLLAKKILEDSRLPAKGSRAMYVSHMRSKGYSAADIATFAQAWQEMTPEP
jgi:hypothetical protein